MPNIIAPAAACGFYQRRIRLTHECSAAADATHQIYPTQSEATPYDFGLLAKSVHR
jgi:hypothetical protein